MTPIGERGQVCDQDGTQIGSEKWLGYADTIRQGEIIGAIAQIAREKRQGEWEKPSGEVKVAGAFNLGYNPFGEGDLLGSGEFGVDLVRTSGDGNLSDIYECLVPKDNGFLERSASGLSVWERPLGMLGTIQDSIRDYPESGRLVLAFSGMKMSIEGGVPGFFLRDDDTSFARYNKYYRNCLGFILSADFDSLSQVFGRGLVQINRAGYVEALALPRRQLVENCPELENLLPRPGKEVKGAKRIVVIPPAMPGRLSEHYSLRQGDPEVEVAKILLKIWDGVSRGKFRPFCLADIKMG